jgi:hypothetical protein
VVREVVVTNFEKSIAQLKTSTLSSEKSQQPNSILPLTQDYLRLNILSRTTKGLFPDIIPSEENLKELVKNFSNEQDVVLRKRLGIKGTNKLDRLKRRSWPTTSTKLEHNFLQQNSIQ